ncbi:MAG: MMPL family transporter [Gammaproteobacteria bacterium]|nr:MMPL family transporter [Gammaproteobacteria bacterium]MBT4146355.1 MMPL family transporter [Gammaproteobacteria bacterium]MBT5223191.1 MMPL family transporter [Gammaproteobacteria bacterium]MBT5824775.1 MMPL family transporter [Gammaproteobacteria bacterium]MBT5966466.1 MMPL family transporter [Gammaproteobacteria bacterium]
MKKNTFVNQLGMFSINHPWWVLLFSLIFVGLSGSGLKNLEFVNNYRVFFGEDNPQLLAFDELQNTYSKSDNVMILVEPANGDVFTRKNLQAIIELTKEGWQLPYSSRVDSISNFQHTIAEEDDLIVADLIIQPLQMSDEKLQYVKQVALNEPLLKDRLISKTGHVTGVNITMQLPGTNPMESMEIAGVVRELVADFKVRHPDLTLHLSGIVMMNNAFGEAAMKDNASLVPLMYGIVLLVLIVCLRSFTATFSVILLIVFSIVAALGLAIYAGVKLTPTSLMSPTIILTMAVADCVHLLVTFLHNMRLGHEKKQAIQESLRINFQPILLTSVTTAIGFMSLNFSDAPPFRDLGNIVALGVMLALVLSVTLLPALMTIMPVRVKAKEELDNPFMKGLAAFVIKRRKALLIGNSLLAVILMGFIPLNEINDEFVKYFDESIEFRRATDFMNDNLSGIYNIEISIDSGSAGGMNEPAYLAKVEQFQHWLEQQPEVVHVNSITDTFKRLNKNMHGDQQQWYALPKQRDLAAQYLLLYEMSLPYGLDLNDQINIDKSGIRVVASMENLSTKQMLDIEQRLHDWMAVNFSEYTINAASPVLMFSHIGQRNIIRMLIGSVAALILISIILIFAFRSVKLGLISLIPNLIPAGMAFGIWGLVDGQVGLGLSVVTGMTIGIVVDDTVHFISKYRRAKVEKGLSTEEAVRYAFSTVGVALWVTSLVLVSGFTVLSTSSFLMNSGMGLMTAITIAVALLMDFLFLPPILMTLDKNPG